uniref:tetratricopeptide repeat protein n=1 Tax=Anaerovibrio sp. TaxID=1872532 RepID=UPI0025F3CF87
NSPYIRYVGAIHEQVVNSQGNKKMVFADKLEFLHTGYSGSIARSKAERNLPILISEMEKATTEKERRRLYPYLMDAYNNLEDYEKTVYYAKKCIDNGYQQIGLEGNFYETLILAMHNAHKPVEEVLETIDKAEKDYPQEPFFPFLRGMVLEEQTDYIGAEQAVLKGLELRKVQEEKMSKGIGVSDTARGMLFYAYERLGNIYSLKGNYEKAADNYFKALQEHKYRIESLRGLCKILQDTDDVELIELLNSIYDRKKDGEFMAKAMKGYVSQGVMSYYGKNVNSYEEGYTYIATHRYDSAVVKLGNRYRELVQLGILGINGMNERPQDGYMEILVSPNYLDRFNDYSKENKAVRRLQEYRVRLGLEKK